MRLYRMELYKLCHKKSFAAGFLFVLLIGLFFFYDDVRLQSCTVNGMEYTGLKAIRANRQITEDFRGVLTDEKVTQIIEKYGFPDEEFDLYNRMKGNFLNTFVMDYASNGYNNGWDDYQIATEAVPLADSLLGRYYAASDMEITLGYYDGWRSFLNNFGVLMLGVSLLILYIISIVFSEEEQVGMKSLLFTTKEGPSKDVLAKITAAFSISVGVWLLAVSFCLLPYCMIYGTDGLHCVASLATKWSFLETPLLMQPLGAYLAEVLLVSLLAVLELCAITICVSACCHSSFYAIVAAGICYVLPFFGFLLYQLGWAMLLFCSVQHPLPSGPLMVCHGILYLLRGFIYSSPVYLLLAQNGLTELSRTNSIGEMKHVYIVLAIAAMLFVLCTIGAYRRYRRPQKL